MRAVLLLGFSLLSLPSVVTAAKPADATAAVIGQALSPSPLADDLRRLTDGIGGRISGSPAMARAVEWGVEAFRAAGVPVRTEAYTQAVTWAEGETRLEIDGAAAFPVALVAEGWSPATPAGGIAAPLVHVGAGSEEEFAAQGSRVRGAILLVDSTVIATWADLNNEYDRTGPIVQRAIAGGARAILWTAARSHRLLYRHTDTVGGELLPLPMATVAREDALRLARTVDASRTPLNVRFSMPNRIGGPVEAKNVVAEIRGRELPDEFVVLGAHLDSWDLGTGALDNGCNAALVIAAARAIHDAGVTPRRTIRFVLFSGEEEGMLGSRAYVKTHAAELDRTRAMMAIDSGVGRITGFSLSGRTDVAATLPRALAAVAALDATALSLEGDLGTDNVDFLLQGVPTLVASQEPATYMENYHAASDTLDKVDLRELTLHVAIAAATVVGIADLAEPLGPRLTRPEIAALLERSGLEKEMKAGGLWAEWAAGQRGRNP